MAWRFKPLKHFAQEVSLLRFGNSGSRIFSIVGERGPFELQGVQYVTDVKV